MEEKLAVRPARPGDFKVLCELYNEVGAWLFDVRGITGQWTRTIPEEEVQLMLDSGEAWVACLGAQPVAAVRLDDHHTIPWEDRRDQALYVHSLAVHPRYQGRGIGRRMLEWAEDIGRQRGKQFLRLDCMAANPRLRQYYRDAGLTDRGPHATHTWYALFEKEIGAQ